jgi:dTDP-4-dehydrorhamnose reductase
MGSDSVFGEPFYGEELKIKKVEKMKIYVLGSKGMLGRYVYTYFVNNGWNTIGITRDTFDASNVYKETFFRTFEDVSEGDVIINCMGTIKPMVDKYGTLNAIRVNSLFPHFLSEFCEYKGINMIHITTDCVFSGKKGLYTENDPHDCTDVYGKTKSLGEPKMCTVMRTSIIGEEVGQGRSLIEWIKSMKDKTANGFTNHNWNGITCLQVAKVFMNIIENKKYWWGVVHVFSPNIVNKYELVKTVSDVYGLNITLNAMEDKNPIDRTMASIYEPRFEIPSIEQQIMEMKEYHSNLIRI